MPHCTAHSCSLSTWCPCYIFWTLIVVIFLLSIEGQRALRFNQNHLNLCSEDVRRSYGFRTWGWVNNDRIFIFGWTKPLMWRDVTDHGSFGARDPIISFSLLLVIARNKHKWTSEGMLKEKVQLTKMYCVSDNCSISVSTSERRQ